MRLRLTNLPSGQYVLKQLLNDGEAIPVGLAESVYNELSTLQWKLRHTILQVAANATTVPTIIKPGKNMINLSGGLTAWETMDAVPEQVIIEFFRVIENGVSCLTAQHSISCGPVNHQEPGYLVQLANLFWNRNHAGIDPHQRLTGTTSSNQVDLSSQGAKENTVPGQADFSQQLIYGTDANVGTNSNVFTIDGTLGQIIVAQNKTADGTNYATGTISPQFPGTGNPGAATLPANAYFRPGMTYVDNTIPTAPVEWICTSAGSNSTSVWAMISGGSGGPGGVQQFKIVSDGGDWWVCNSWDGTTQGTVNLNVIKPMELRTSPANGIASATIRAVTYNYSYAAVAVGGVTGYYTRTVSVAGTTIELDYMIPDPQAGNIIYALPCITNICGGIPETVLTATLVNPGTGGTYAVNDVLTVAGGTRTVAATIKVLTVSAGKILTYSITNSGAYSVAPTLTANAVTGGGGSGATFDLTMAPQLIDLNVDARAWAF